MIHVFPKEGYLNTTFRVFGDNDQMIRVDLKYNKIDSTETQQIITKHIFLSPGKYHELTLPAGEVSFCYGNERVIVQVHDAIKLGGSTHKNSFIFDNNPWCLLVMKDRTYFYNRDTKQEFVESISPDKVECISKNKLLICNKSRDYEEYSVFDTDKLIAIANGVKMVYVDENVFIENKDDALIITDYDSESSTVVYFDEYIIDQERKHIYILFNNAISCLNLQNLNKRTLIHKCYHNSIVTLIDKSTYVELDRNGKIFKVFRLEDSQCIYNGVSDSPICKLHNRSIFNFYDYKNQIVDVFNSVSNDLLDKSKLDIVFAAKELRFFPINDSSTIYIESCKLICQRNFYSEEYDVKIVDKSFVYADSTKVIDYSKHYNAIKEVINDIICLSSNKSLVLLRQGKIIFQSNSAKVIHSNSNCYIVEEKDINCCVYTLNNDIKLISTDNIDVQFLPNDLLWYPKKQKIKYLRNNIEIQGSIKIRNVWGEKYIFVDGKAFLVDNVIIDTSFGNFPDIETLDSISLSGKYMITKNESHIYIGFASEQKKKFVFTPILINLYDYSQYEDVLFTDDGKYLIYSRWGQMYLKDIQSKQETQLGNTKHIRHVNGYMPLVKTDLSRRPVLINPLTMEIINEESLRNFQFVSPNGCLYAKSDQIIKVYNTLTNNYITLAEVEDLKNKYNDSYLDNERTKQQKEASRLETYELYKEIFDKIAKNTLYTDHFYASRFTDLFLNEYGFVNIFCTQNHKQLHEIALGPKLLFLNYVSFSNDSRYVAITGKYKDNGGLFLLYDMQLGKELFKIDGKTNLGIQFQDITLMNKHTKAIWSSAFSRLGIFATYSSDPNLYIIKLANDKIIANIIKNRSFLAFSPDGKYVALSRQGYIPYGEGTNVNWGHMPSTDVYVYEASNMQVELAHFNDFPAEGRNNDCICADRKQTVASVAFSMDNSKLMMVGKDQTVVVRNIRFS